MLLYVLGNNSKKLALQYTFFPLYITLYYHFFPHYSFPSHTAFPTTTTTIFKLQQSGKTSYKIIPRCDDAEAGGRLWRMPTAITIADEAYTVLVVHVWLVVLITQ